MVTIQFKILPNPLTEIEISPTQILDGLEELSSIEEASSRFSDELILKLKTKQLISEDYLRSLCIQSSSKILSLFLDTLAEKEHASLLLDQTTETVITQLFLFYFSFTPDNHFYDATHCLFTTFQSHFETLKHHLFHTAISHTLELKECNPFQSKDPFSLSASDIKDQLMPLYFISHLEQELSFKFKLNQQFEVPEHSQLPSNKTLNTSQLIKDLQSQKTSHLRLHKLFDSRLQVQLEVLKELIATLSHHSLSTCETFLKRASPGQIANKMELQLYSKELESTTSKPFFSNSNSLPTTSAQNTSVSSDVNSHNLGCEPLGTKDRPPVVNATFVINRANDQTKQMTSMSNETRIYLKRRPKEMLLFLVKLYNYGTIRPGFNISERFENSMINIFHYHTTSLYSDYTQKCIDYLFKNFPKQLNRLKHSIYYNGLSNAYRIHTKNTATSSEIKARLQSLATTLEASKKTNFKFNPSFHLNTNRTSIKELLIHISRLEANPIGLQRLVRLVQPKSLRFQQNKSLLKQRVEPVIDLQAIKCILKRFKKD